MDSDKFYIVPRPRMFPDNRKLQIDLTSSLMNQIKKNVIFKSSDTHLGFRDVSTLLMWIFYWASPLPGPAGLPLVPSDMIKSEGGGGPHRSETCR